MRPFFSLVRAAPLAALVSLSPAGCSGGVPIDVGVGPLGFDVDASRITVPAGFQSSGTLARVPCGAGAQCPSLAPSGLTLQCVGGACDPAPYTFDLGIMNVVDLTAYSSELGTIGSNLQSVTIAQMSWQASAAGLRVPVGPIEVFWGPESSTGIGSDGVRRLGRIPVIQFTPAGAASGDVELDAAGNAALSSHLLNTSRRFRLFARATIDLVAGGALPAGRASIQVRMRVHAETRLLR